MRTCVLTLVCLLGAFAASSCATYSEPAPEAQVIPAGSVGSGAILVSQLDYAFRHDVLRGKPGLLDFRVTNTGGETHEFVVVPMKGERYGSPIGEIEALYPGESAGLRVYLPAGKYAFVCLLVSRINDGVPSSHLAVGMSSQFEVVD